MLTRRTVRTSSPLLTAIPLALALVALLSPRAGAQGTQDDASRELRRILRLTNGQTIRAVAKLDEGAWSYRAKAGWRQLPAGLVASTELERDVLNSWRERRKDVEPVDLELRVELADWALGAGLVTEGLEEMSAVLALEPDHAAALAALSSHADVMRVPSVEVPDADRPVARQELLRFGASMPAGAARELAVLELRKLPADAGLRDELLAEYRSRVVTRRSFAALALRRIFPGEAIRPVLLHAILDPSDEVRAASSLALRAAEDPAVIVPVVRVLDTSESPVLRMRAAEALGLAGYPAAVEPLVSRLAAAQSDAGTPGRIPHSNIFVGRQYAYIQDFDVEVAQFQAVADPQVNVLIEGSALDAAVAGVQTVQVAVEVASVRSSLERLTGESPGHTSKAWLAWWETNGSRWRSEELSRPRTGETPAGS